MAYNTTILSVLIASPGDVPELRDLLRQEVDDWNRNPLSRLHGVELRHITWELDSYSEVGRGDAQTVINRQLLDRVDIVVGVFHSRLGTPTGRAVSGTAEELLGALKRGLPLHVYLSLADIPRDHDPEQLHALNGFVGDLREQGLLGEFSSDDELLRQVRRALDADVAAHLASAETPSEGGIDAAISSVHVRPQDRVNRAVDRVLTLPMYAPDATFDGSNEWRVETFATRQAEILALAPELLLAVLDAVRASDPAADASWLDALPDLARNPHRGGASHILHLLRAPGALLYHGAGAIALAEGRDDLVGRLLSSSLQIEDPYNGFLPASAVLRAELAFPSDWPGRDLTSFLQGVLEGPLTRRVAERALEQWAYLHAVANTYLSSVRQGVFGERPFLRVSGQLHTSALEVVVAREIRERVGREADSHQLLTAGMCGGSWELFDASAQTFESQYGSWANNRDWSALPNGGGILPSGPHVPGDRTGL